ncbi:aminoacyl-tRNA hydrolase [bacterium]|nr:aminoacyl-tRNA hydrolase [bacterium]
MPNLRILRLFCRSRLRYEDLDHIVLGLNNPGRRYAATRHNIGARVLENLAIHHSLRFLPGKGSFEGARMEGVFGSALLALPSTFMNRSGVAGRELTELCGLDPSRCLTILDDLDLPPGRLRFRAGGSSGGHRGLESLIYEWGREDFPRLRLGIGRPSGGDIPDFVLSSFPEEDLDRVNRIVEAAADAVMFYLENGLERAASRFNSLEID